MKHLLTAAVTAIGITTGIADAQPMPGTPRLVDEIGITAGSLVYQGDLSPSPTGAWKTARPGVAAQVTHRTGTRTALRAGLLLGGLRGDEGLYPRHPYRTERNLAFRTRILELGVGGLWAPWGGLDGSRLTTPYLAGQAGVALLRVRPDASGMNGAFALTETSALLPLAAADAAHRKPGLLPVAALGIGVRRPVGEQWILSLESGYRWSPSDYVDGFSRLANPGSRDHYAYHAVGMAYRMPRGRTTRCPRPGR